MDITHVYLAVSSLTFRERRLLKDTINEGEWGSCDYEFEMIGWPRFVETSPAIGFITNMAKNAGHFKSMQVAPIFMSIYRKMCPLRQNTIGAAMSHCHNWWSSHNGDVLFIRSDMYSLFKQWAEEPMLVKEGGEE